MRAAGRLGRGHIFIAPSVELKLQRLLTAVPDMLHQCPHGCITEAVRPSETLSQTACKLQRETRAALDFTLSPYCFAGALQDELLAKVQTVFVQISPTDPGLCGAPLAGAVLELLPLTCATGTWPRDNTARLVFLADRLVRHSCKGRCIKASKDALVASSTAVVQSLWRDFSRLCRSTSAVWQS